MTKHPSHVRMVIGAFCLAATTTAWAQIPRPQDPKTPPAPKPGLPAEPSTAVKDGPLSPADQAFVKKAAQGGHKEVALAKLAQQKASSEKVKSYAQRLERDHSQANDELVSMAARKNLTLPSAERTLPEQKKLEPMSGAAFDRAYIDAMILDHKKDIAEFEQQAAKTSDPDLKAFVQKILPTLREHLKEAETTRQALGAS